MTIAEQLKNARAKAELTQEEVAEKLGVSRQTVSNWENGRSYPDIVSMITLSGVYGVSLDALLKGDDALMEHLEESTDTVKSNKKLIAASAANILLFILILLFSGIIAQNKYLTGGVLIFGVCSITALFYQIIRKF
ncbi:MAG: helix-turn-helix transcriptional regulator [Oscillospiraceae bacterium]|nr:helix-turn-helix transcriptional regulator [Oscillospiraceae bacterium]